MAEVEVTRRSACGHDCAKCGGCGGLETQTLYVTAFNGVAAQVGDRVLGIAVLVYLLPVVLFFIGYGAGSVLGGGAAQAAICGGLLFALGILGAMWYSRQMKKKNDVPFAITQRL